MGRRASIPLVLLFFTTVTLDISAAIAATAANAQADGRAPQNAVVTPTRPTTVAASGQEPKQAAPPSGQVAGPQNGALLLCSLSSPEIRDEFFKLAGGRQAKIVMVVNQVPAGADAGPSAAKAWGVREVTFWRFTDRKSAENQSLLAALARATGVWISGGKPTEYLAPLLDSPAHRELAKLLARGGIIGGESAGAMIQSTFVALPPSAPYAGPALEGLGFARNLVIFPHFNGASGKFPGEFCQRLLTDHPGLAGLALPDGSAVIVRGQSVEVMGKGHVDLMLRAKDGTVSTTTHDSASRFALPEGLQR